VDLHVFDEQEQQTSAAIPFGIDTLGLWEEKPWKIDKFPIAHNYFDCDKGSTCLQPHVSDRWCANLLMAGELPATHFLPRGVQTTTPRQLILL